ncbi:unnamed protein product [Clavelina lepadiformis]|uniref:WxxW domain-containing protein n=1 Tax=Clavelina lepadiformis TaxID=159417 RepID=A0ABP0FZK4_CLALP
MIDDTEECSPSPICPTRPNRFYTPDGSCNNLLDGRKGMAGQPHKRLLPADFADGKGLPRTGQNGKPLPSGRSISTYMNELGAPASNDISFFLVIFGQYLTHDITDTPVVHRAGLDCFCGSEDPGCDNIEVPTNDVFYLEAQRSCINFVRSQPVPDSNCDTQVRQTKNNITPYIDAGTVYGANQFQLSQLLEQTSRVGKLKTGRLEPYGHSPRHSPSLPLSRQVHHTFAEEIACPVNVHKPDGVDCFAAGDVRANENPGLASMHTLFVRLHNKIVVELSAINRIWSKERLINTARLIVSAVEQRITYDQFLPALLGSTIMKRFDLNLNQQGYWHGYDATYDATTSNAFITSVLRVGHTLVSPELPRSSPSYHQQGTSLQLLNSFFDTTPLLTTSFGGANSILRGLTNTAAQTMDPAFVEDLQNFLFAPAGMYGVDLMSLNIQRARDHGVPSYNEFRVFCGLKRAFTFDELTEIPRQRRRKLQHLYRNVDDIDLYIAGISEAPLKEGLLGPTFACLAGYQFRDIKKGDRLWHENGGAFTVFTPAQLQAIRDYTMSKVLCDNLNDMVSVQSNPFLQISVIGNIRRPCSQYPALNLEAWKDKNCDEQPSRKVGRVFTSWFPANHDGHSLSSQQVLSDLFLNRPDDVCSKTLGSEERIVKGNKQIRFICPAGSIRGSDFPNVDESKGAWSFWENEFTPSYPDFGDEEIAEDVSRERCEGPIAIQVFTTNGIPARESGEVFRVLSPSAGFECRGEDQEDGRCEDYKVRYFCKKDKVPSLEVLFVVLIIN